MIIHTRHQKMYYWHCQSGNTIILYDLTGIGVVLIISSEKDAVGSVGNGNTYVLVRNKCDFHNFIKKQIQVGGESNKDALTKIDPVFG